MGAPGAKVEEGFFLNASREEKIDQLEKFLAIAEEHLRATTTPFLKKMIKEQIKIGRRELKELKE